MYVCMYVYAQNYKYKEKYVKIKQEKHVLTE